MKCCCFGLLGACLTSTAIFNDSVKRKNYSSESTGRFCVTVTKLWTLHTPWLNILFMCFNRAWHCKSHGWKTTSEGYRTFNGSSVNNTTPRIRCQTLSTFQSGYATSHRLRMTHSTPDGKPPGRQVWSDATNSAWSVWSNPRSRHWVIPQTMLADAFTQVQDFFSMFLFWLKIK